MGKQWKQCLGSKITADGDCSHEIKRLLLLGSKVMTSLDSILKSRGITLPAKVRLVKGMVFPVVMYGCDSWRKLSTEELMLLNCGVGEDSWESLGLHEIRPKGDQSWVLIGRTDAEAETPILWPPDTKNWLIWKDPDAGKDWRREENRTTEDENDSGMASLTRWTWVWVNSESWWWTGRPGVLWFMRLQRVGHDWVTELTYVCYHFPSPLG